MTTAKTCTGCSKELPVEVFHFKDRSRGVRHSHCPSCRNERQLEHRRSPRGKARVKKWREDKREKHRQIIWDYLLTHPCVDCGESDPIVLQFDHRGDKSYEISKMPWRNGADTLRNEIEKCDVRCANCHTRKTAYEQKHWKVSYATR